MKARSEEQPVFFVEPLISIEDEKSILIETLLDDIIIIW